MADETQDRQAFERRLQCDGTTRGPPGDLSMSVQPDLWERVARLDQYCRVRIISRFDESTRVGWRAIVDRRDGQGTTIRVDGETLIAVLSETIVQTEAAGWSDAACGEGGIQAS